MMETEEVGEGEGLEIKSIRKQRMMGDGDRIKSMSTLCLSKINQVTKTPSVKVQLDMISISGDDKYMQTKVTSPMIIRQDSSRVGSSLRESPAVLQRKPSQTVPEATMKSKRSQFTVTKTSFIELDNSPVLFDKDSVQQIKVGGKNYSVGGKLPLSARSNTQRPLTSLSSHVRQISTGDLPLKLSDLKD